MATRKTKKKRNVPWLKYTLCAAFTMVLIASGGFAWKLRGKAVREAEARTAFEQAQQQYAAEDYEPALVSLEKASVLLADDPDFLRLFGQVRLQVPQPKNQHVTGALEAFHRYVAAATTPDPAVYRSLHLLYKRLGGNREAIKFGEDALEAAGEDFDLAMSMLDARMKLEQYSQVIDECAKLAERFPLRLEIDRIWIDAMLKDMQPRDVIQGHVRDRVDSLESPPHKSLVQQAYFELIGETDAAVDSLDRLVSQPPTETAYVIQVASALDSEGRRAEALQLLEDHATNSTPQATANGKNDSNRKLLNKSLIYRYWQGGHFDKLLEACGNQDLIGFDDDEIRILRCLALLYKNRPDEIKDSLAALKKSPSRLAKVWEPILRESLSGGKPSKLLELCTQALKTFPNLTYLVNHQALAYELVGEQDQAIATYRKAAKLAPKWIAPHAALARIHNTRGEHELAMYEASHVLATNSQFEAVLQLSLRSAIELTAARGQLTQNQQGGVTNLLNRIVDRLDEAESGSPAVYLVHATREFVAGDRDAADEQLRLWYESQTKRETQELRIALLIVSDETLERTIGDEFLARAGRTRRQLIDESLVLAKADSVEQGLQHIKEYRHKGQPLDGVDLDATRAQFLTDLGHESAREVWEQVADKYSDNPKIVRLAIRSGLLDADACQTRIDQLKALSAGKGSAWRIEQARLNLALTESQEKVSTTPGEADEKLATQTILLLKQVLTEVPNHVEAHLLLAEAFERVGQPEKAINSLADAQKIGVDHPQIKLAHAMRLFSEGSLEVAVELAKAAGTTRSTSPQFRLEVANLLLKHNANREAMEVIEAVLPSELEDTDGDFIVAAAWAMAAVKTQELSRLQSRLQPRLSSKPSEGSAADENAANGQRNRWFKLWVETASMSDGDADESLRWLEVATQQIADDHERRRLVGRAWYRFAKRTENAKHFLAGAKAIAPLVKQGQAIEEDFLLLGALLQRCGKRKSAIRVYERLHRAAPESAIAMNNLAALLLLEGGDIARCESLAKRAVAIKPLPAFQKTLEDVMASRVQAGG